jgi:hypothetical protein
MGSNEPTNRSTIFATIIRTYLATDVLSLECTFNFTIKSTFVCSIFFAIGMSFKDTYNAAHRITIKNAFHLTDSCSLLFA